jgi:transaldolase
VARYPRIFDHAIKNSTAYDAQIREKLLKGESDEALFFELALEDITRAADLFRPTYDRTNGVDGWVSLEVSPLLAHDQARTVKAAKDLFARAARPNLFIKIPGTREGLPAIEESIFAGIPVNVTLLFSLKHYLSAAEAVLRGIERRINAGLNPNVASVASDRGSFQTKLFGWTGALSERQNVERSVKAQSFHAVSLYFR